jgi:teichuronic acid biosynthesis glycosyltransferase TuaG
MVKVSVIIPTYNRAQQVQKAVESVLIQTFRNFEIIVVDDGSTDNTEELLRKLAGIRYIRIGHSGFPAVTRNTGIREASGNYIAFLDSDDTWLPEKLEKQVILLDGNDEIGLVCTNGYKVRKGEDRKEKFFTLSSDHCGFLLDKLLKRNFVITSSVLVRKELLQMTGLFSESMDLRRSQDYDLWLRVAAVSEIYFLAEPSVVYLDAPMESVRKGFQRSQSWQVLYIILGNFCEFCASHKTAISPPVELLQMLEFTYQRKYAREKWREGHRLAGLKSAFLLGLQHPLKSLGWFFQKGRSLFRDDASNLESEEEL